MSGQAHMTTATPANCVGQSANIVSSSTKDEIRGEASVEHQLSAAESDCAKSVQALTEDDSDTPTSSNDEAQSAQQTASTEQSLDAVSDDKTSSDVKIADQKVPDEILSLINGKSPDEVVNIINGQLAELKAVETLRDVEEECLDELTNEVIAKITKESLI